MELAAVIPAAGKSIRLQGINKLLLPVSGEPMISVVVRTAQEAGCDPIIVVTGDDHQVLSEALKGHAVLLVNNPDPAAGMAGSLVAGFDALPDTAEGAVAMLADMPLMTAGTLDALKAAFIRARGDKIVYPAKDGVQGNPVIFPRKFFSEILSLNGDAGGKQLLVKYESETISTPIQSDEIFFDVDTSDDYSQLLEKLKS